MATVVLAVSVGFVARLSSPCLVEYIYNADDLEQAMNPNGFMGPGPFGQQVTNRRICGTEISADAFFCSGLEG